MAVTAAELGRRNATVTTTAPARLFCMFGTEFRRLQDAQPDVARRLEAAVVRRQAELAAQSARWRRHGEITGSARSTGGGGEPPPPTCLAAYVARAENVFVVVAPWADTLIETRTSLPLAVFGSSIVQTATPLRRRPVARRCFRPAPCPRR